MASMRALLVGVADAGLNVGLAIDRLRPTLERALGHLARLPESAGAVARLRRAWT